MIKLNDDLLAELGLGALPPEEKKKLLAHIYETLEMRVGMKLAEQMTDAQLDEFEQFINRNDEAGALRWLETNFPHYKDVVAKEFEGLKIEVKQAAPQIVAAAQRAVALSPQQGAADPTYQQQTQSPYYYQQPASPPVQFPPQQQPPQQQPWDQQQPPRAA